MRRTAVRCVAPVDIHSHFLPRRVPDFASRHGGDGWPGIRHDGALPDGTYGYGRGCAAMLMVGGEDFRPVTEAAFDPAARIEDLNMHGIRHQLVSATPLFFQWHRSGPVGLDVSMWMNDTLAEFCQSPAAGGRLHGLCQVPLQDIDLACKELSRAKATGHLGVQIGNHVGPKDLDDEGLITFLQHCADEDMPVLVHPWDMDPVGGRTKNYMMGWTVGMPMETHLSVAAMVLGGAFDRLPEKLRLCFAHGGGAFPYLLGRLENAWRERSVARGKSEKPPSEYLHRFSVDSAVFDQRALRLLVDTMGADRIMLGSDYPFPLGEQRIGNLVRSASFLSDNERAAILANNAVGFFNVPVGGEAAARPAGASAPAPAGSQTAVLNWVGGKSVPAVDGATVPLVSSTTGAQRGTVCASKAADVDAAVDTAAAAVANGAWADLESRCALLDRVASVIEGRLAEFAEAESADTGKPLNLTRVVDIPRAVANFRFFAGLARHTSDAEFRQQDGRMAALNYAQRRPVGVVGLVTPWNLPLYLLSWKVAPALAMGNTIVAKPSELTPSTASMLGDALREAGLPDGAYNVVHGLGAECGNALVAHPKVAAVSFTGGTKTGAVVAAAAAPQFKKVSLELGGKNASIVFADCDIDAAVKGVVRAAFLNSGQICLCGSRVLVQSTADGFYEKFAKALVEAAKELRVGVPSDPATDMGPVISAQHKGKIQSYVDIAKQEGGEVLCGGADPEISAEYPNGAFHAPTIVGGLHPDARAAQEEVFGPFITLHPFTSEDDAVSIANGTQYGLAANLWTNSLDRAHRVAGRIDAGTVWVNCWLHRELHMPFGGTKASGVNREGGVHSLNFYSETSTICVKLGDKTPPPMPGFAARSA